jgi:hypothetical protein
MNSDFSGIYLLGLVLGAFLGVKTPVVFKNTYYLSLWLASAGAISFWLLATHGRGDRFNFFLGAIAFGAFLGWMVAHGKMPREKS